MLAWTNLKANQQTKHTAKTNKLRPPQKYYLGPAYPNIYLTQREAECAIGLLEHGTSKSIARHLRLSPRTIEFYIRNIKRKLACQTRAQLLKHIKLSTFLLISFSRLP